MCEDDVLKVLKIEMREEVGHSTTVSTCAPQHGAPSDITRQEMKWYRGIFSAPTSDPTREGEGRSGQAGMMSPAWPSRHPRSLDRGLAELRTDHTARTHVCQGRGLSREHRRLCELSLSNSMLLLSKMLPSRCPGTRICHDRGQSRDREAKCTCFARGNC